MVVQCNLPNLNPLMSNLHLFEMCSLVPLLYLHYYTNSHESRNLIHQTQSVLPRDLNEVDYTVVC